MQAEIIAIGDEILIGQTIDTNSAFIASQLSSNGIVVKQKRVIADEKDAITEALDGVLPDTDLVFMTGGLGPTKDDITKSTLTTYFGGELEFHEDVYERIVDLFKTFNRVPSEVNRSQAYLPTSCAIVPNDIGTASGMRFQKNNTYFFSLPGVPYETEYLVEKKIMPWINQVLRKGKAVHKNILTQGVPESDLAQMLEGWENELPAEIKLAYLPSPGMVKLRLSSYDLESDEASSLIDAEIDKMKSLLGEIIFGESAESLQEVIGILLKRKGVTVATAESCTGGYLAHLITSIAGSSEYYKGSILSYSNEAKMKLLGVKKEDLLNYGAVSKEVIEQMAIQARHELDTDFAIATSGVAGPGGGSYEKPVGTVWIAVAGPNGIKSKKFHFGKDRLRNIKKSALMALDMLRREIQKIN